MPAGTQAAGTVRVVVPASGGAPWAGLALCDRGPCSGSLFPPQAAVAFAAVLVLRLHQLNIPSCCKLIEQGLDPAVFSLSRIITIKNSPTFSVRLSFVAGTPLPPARSAFLPIPRELSQMINTNGVIKISLQFSHSSILAHRFSHMDRNLVSFHHFHTIFPSPYCFVRIAFSILRACPSYFRRLYP